MLCVICVFCCEIWWWCWWPGQSCCGIQRRRSWQQISPNSMTFSVDYRSCLFVNWGFDGEFKLQWPTFILDSTVLEEGPGDQLPNVYVV